MHRQRRSSKGSGQAEGVVVPDQGQQGAVSASRGVGVELDDGVPDGVGSLHAAVGQAASNTEKAECSVRVGNGGNAVNRIGRSTEGTVEGNGSQRRSTLCGRPGPADASNIDVAAKLKSQT